MVDKSNLDIFKQASQIALNVADSEKAENKVVIVDQLEKALAITTEGDKDWVDLSAAMKGRYAKKFMDILDTMPDREFVRNYLKALEYFQPKITRQEPSINGEQDNIIQIQILKTDSDGNHKIIDITDSTHE
jgi:hypothetical protein